MFSFFNKLKRPYQIANGIFLAYAVQDYFTNPDSTYKDLGFSFMFSIANVLNVESTGNLSYDLLCRAASLCSSQSILASTSQSVSASVFSYIGIITNMVLFHDKSQDLINSMTQNRNAPHAPAPSPYLLPGAAAAA